jgi:hypothetical protein
MIVSTAVKTIRFCKLEILQNAVKIPFRAISIIMTVELLIPAGLEELWVTAPVNKI